MIGDQLLSENTYSSAPDASYGTLTQMKYGNGDTVNYGYDEFKRMTSMQYGSDASKKFSYEYGANGQVARVTNHELNRTVLSEQDSCSRPMRITHLSGTEHLYTGEVTYDAQNNLHTFEEQVGDDRTAYTTTFSYDVENKPTLLKYNDANTDKVAYAYDALGRMATRTVTVGGKVYETSYGYITGEQGAGSTTGLIATIEQTGGNFTYTYDANGNISCVQQDGKYTYYTYDALGQLIRVDDQNDTTSGASGTTWVYAYDKGGNILSKKRYTYIETAVEITDTTPVKDTMEFSYSNAAWKDQLTAVNGKPISYDNIGNPTQYGADNDADKITYEWEKGRQLKKIVKPGETVEFKYNENGLRIQKAATSTGTTNYTLHGKNIVHMTQGSNTLHFFYDASNKPAIVEYNGTKYAYVHNLQGDIVAILDSNGAVVVQYMYDAWGRPISKTGSMASTLGTVQPFRYRGYVYDEETGLYYLGLRYYSVQYSRFINADECMNEDSLFGFNLFCYAANSPICCIDISGRIVFTLLGGVLGFACQGVISLLQKKSSKEAMGAALGGMVSGALNGLATDLTIATGGLGVGASMLVGSVASLAGSLVEYAYIHDGLEGYSLDDAINAALSGAIASLLSHFTVDRVKDMLDTAWNEALDESIRLLRDFGITNDVLFENFEKIYTAYVYASGVYNASLTIPDLVEIPTAQ